MQSAIASGVKSRDHEIGLNTCESRYWALRELARRGGVTPGQFSAWQVEFLPDLTVVWLDGAGRRCIRIPSHGAEILRRPISNLVTNFASWMFTANGMVSELVPTFVIPYCLSKLQGRPIFCPSTETQWRANLIYSLPSLFASLDMKKQWLPFAMFMGGSRRNPA